MDKILVISNIDNAAVALTDIKKGETLKFSNNAVVVAEDIPVKHKVALQRFEPGDHVYMYGVPVGEVMLSIPCGGLLSIRNVKHTAAEYKFRDEQYFFNSPDVSHLKYRTFDGFHRKDGQVGTGNYWLFIPMVFCQNRNLCLVLNN